MLRLTTQRLLHSTLRSPTRALSPSLHIQALACISPPPSTHVPTKVLLPSNFSPLQSQTSSPYSTLHSYSFSTTATPLTDDKEKDKPKKKRTRPSSKAADSKKKKPTRKRKSKQVLQEELESALEKGGERVIRVRNLDNEIPKLSERILEFGKKLPQLSVQATKTLAKSIYILLTDPKKAMEWMVKMKNLAVDEFKHFWLGLKLLYAEASTSARIMRRVLRGSSLSRRERKQLQRTTGDLLRLVPVSIFFIIPFMEFLLPFALKIFPNMLPSTFQASYQREENMKRELKLRLALAEFLQNTIKDTMAGARDSENVTEETRATAEEILQFIERAQSGEIVDSEEIMKFASLFEDELMLDNISRPQLVGMCRFMGLNSFGNDNLLRFQLRNNIRQLKKDDQDILWEGLDTLTKEELQSACSDRGMRSTGLTKAGYLRQMRQWLDLSINKNIPPSLLIMSRALNITAADSPEVAIATSLSSMDEEVITEVALEAAASNDESPDMRALKLESIRYQNELIADEEKDREETKKKVEESKELEAEAEIQEAKAVTPDNEPVMTISKEEELVDEAPTDQSIDKMLEKAPRELTLEEVEALESLVFQSSVEKERKTLHNMKELKSEMDVAGLLASGRVGSQTKGSKSASRMMSKLDTMIADLEQELELVDKTIGDRLNFLDKDQDGVLSAEELKAAVRNILRGHETEEQAAYAVSQIDENNDGKVTVAELVAWIEKQTNLMELTGHSRSTPPESSSAPETRDTDAAKSSTKN